MSQINIYLPLSAAIYFIASIFAFRIGMALSVDCSNCFPQYTEVIFLTIIMFVASFGIYNFALTKMKNDQKC